MMKKVVGKEQRNVILSKIASSIEKIQDMLDMPQYMKKVNDIFSKKNVHLSHQNVDYYSVFFSTEFPEFFGIFSASDDLLIRLVNDLEANYK